MDEKEHKITFLSDDDDQAKKTLDKGEEEKTAIVDKPNRFAKKIQTNTTVMGNFYPTVMRALVCG